MTRLSFWIYSQFPGGEQKSSAMWLTKTLFNRILTATILFFAALQAAHRAIAECKQPVFSFSATAFYLSVKRNKVCQLTLCGVNVSTFREIIGVQTGNSKIIVALSSSFFLTAKG